MIKVFTECCYEFGDVHGMRGFNYQKLDIINHCFCDNRFDGYTYGTNYMLSGNYCGYMKIRLNNDKMFFKQDII